MKIKLDYDQVDHVIMKDLKRAYKALRNSLKRVEETKVYLGSYTDDLKLAEAMSTVYTYYAGEVLK